VTALCRRLLTGPLLDTRRRGEIAKPRMPPLAVVEDLDVLGDLADGLGAGVVMAVAHQFVLERTPKLSMGALS
jgi:hypothetical protein